MISRKNVGWIVAGILVGIGSGLIALYALGAVDPIIGKYIVNQATFKPTFQEVNAPALDFELENLSGERVRLKDTLGHPVMINFWATWCGPCRLEMPLIQQHYEKFAPDLIVLAVNDAEPVEDVRAFVEELGLKFPVLLDPDEKTINLYRIRGYPTTYFIDSDGMVKFQHLGVLDEKQLSGYLEEIGANQ